MLNAVFLLEGGREVSMQTFVGPRMRSFRSNLRINTKTSQTKSA